MTVTLVVEDGSQVPNANSYISLAEADTYAEEVGNLQGWSGRKARVELAYADNPSDDDSVTINGTTYTFKDTLASANDIKIGADADETFANLRKALNDSGVAGTDYGTGTTKNTTVTMNSDPANGIALLEARVEGTAPNAFAVSSSFTSDNNYFDGDTFADGTARVTRLKRIEALIQAARYMDTRYTNMWRGTKVDDEQVMQWPRVDALDDSGYWIDSDEIPLNLKRAQAEFAFATLDSSNPILAPNVTNPASIKRTRVKAAVVETETEYTGGGSTPNGMNRHFGQAELLLRELIIASGRIRRA